MVRWRRQMALVVVIAATLAPASARAESANVAQAQALFDEALALMKAKQYAQACPKLEQSDQLDPGMGTKYRLGECYESWGKIASAWSIFTAVATASKRDGKIERAGVAGRRAALLAPRLPRMLLDLPAPPSTPGLELLRDGQVIPPDEWTTKVAIDPGAHEISARAPGKIAWSTMATFVERATTTVPVPVLIDAPRAAAPIVVKAPPPPPPRMSTPRKIALATGGLGVVGLVIGSVFGVRAGSQWSSAKATCADPVGVRSCTAAGSQLSKDALTSATVSTVGFAVSGAALATAGILWFGFKPSKSAPAATSLRISPLLGPGEAAARLEGSF